MNAAVLIALAGLIVSIIGAAWKLCVTVTEATTAVKALTQRIDRLDDDNAKDHTEMWDKISTAAKTAWTFISGVYETAATWFNNTIITPISALTGLICR